MHVRERKGKENVALGAEHRTTVSNGANPPRRGSPRAGHPKQTEGGADWAPLLATEGVPPQARGGIAAARDYAAKARDSAPARFAALTKALIDAVTMLPSIPTP